MLAVAFVVALVTGAVIISTEGKVRETYSRLAEERVRAQVDEFLEMRKVRLDGQRELLGKIAASEVVKDRLESGDFSHAEMIKLGSAIESLGVGGGRLLEGAMKLSRLAGSSPNQTRPISINPAKRLIFLVDTSGELHLVRFSRFRRKTSHRETRKQLQKIEGLGAVQVGYLIIEPEGEGKQLVEFAVAPVQKDGDQGLLGAVLVGQVMGMNKSKTANAAAHNEQEKGSHDSMLTGVMTEGEVFSGRMSASMIEEITHTLDDELLKTLDQSPDHGRVIDVDDESYRLFCVQLNPGGTLPPSYEVLLYPLAQLKSDLRDLRLQGSGVGTGALWFGVFMAWLLSRRFARPIREMAAATEEIRKGNYEVSVKVRSKDEVGDLAESFNEMAGELKTKEQIRDVLGKVADEAVAEALISGSLELGGETRTVSILFCDIRGFSALSETMEPGDVIALLNDHMTAMTRIVYEHRGVVDKFIGDEIMAVFGAPKTYGDDAENAALCAVKMIEERARLNQELEHPFEVGIGVATGSVVVGCIGSMDRLNYTVIGERVNRAARLSGLAGPGQTVVDETTWEMVAECASGTEMENVNLKGYSGEVRAFLLEAVGERGLTQSR